MMSSGHKRSSELILKTGNEFAECHIQHVIQRRTLHFKDNVFLPQHTACTTDVLKRPAGTKSLLSCISDYRVVLEPQD